MKTALFYYSVTGNTELVCKYMLSKMPQLELVDIAKSKPSQTGYFDVIGIAAPVFYLNTPPIVSSFLNNFESTEGKPVFLLSTYGMMPGKVMRVFEKELNKKGCVIFNYLLLQMPESFPPFIAKGWTAKNSPSQNEIALLISYIESVKYSVKQMELGIKPNKKQIKTGFLNSLIPTPSAKKNLMKFGDLVLNDQLCNSCGICKESCVYQAVLFDEKPSFNMQKCAACFACYNKCPQKALSTTKISASFQYHRPANNLVEKFI